MKFLSIPAPLAIPQYPERNTPTLLFYHATNIARQVVTLASLNGVRTNLRNLEILLTEVGCIAEGDFRLKEGREDEDGDGKDEGRGRGIKQGGTGRGTGARADEDDDDWD